MCAAYTDTPLYPYARAVPVNPSQGEQNGTALPLNQPNEVNDYMVSRLTEQGFTVGLARSLARNIQAFPYRIWIVDNSGSMQSPDGHRIVETLRTNDVKVVPCTRWEEIRECVNYHIKMAGLVNAPTRFRLLNHPDVGPQEFGIAEAPGTAESDVRTALAIMAKVKPRGSTPLTNHVQEIKELVTTMSPELRNAGKRVVIVLATDGLPTDEYGVGGEVQQQEFVASLRLLEELPVWVVIRLCTDEDDVVNFYNDLDKQLELSLEVLDDFCSEAAEVYEHNDWLNYALPLHRCREMGYHDTIFDLLDERPLVKSELRDFCALLFGEGHFDGVADPSVNWAGFARDISRLMKSEGLQWNPVTKKMGPWIDMKKLNRSYDDSSQCNVM